MSNFAIGDNELMYHVVVAIPTGKVKESIHPCVAGQCQSLSTQAFRSLRGDHSEQYSVPHATLWKREITKVDSEE